MPLHLINCPFRLTSNQLLSVLKVSLGGCDSSQLAAEYEEFFLNNADDIAEILKKSLKSVAAGTPTHLQAQQMVCTMIQVCACEVCACGVTRRPLQFTIILC